MTKLINNVSKIFFIFILGIILFGITNTLIAAPLNYAWYSYVVSLIFLIGLFFLMVYSSKPIDKLFCKTGSYFSNFSVKKLALILGVICLISKIAGVFIFNCDSNLHVDMSKYISFADQISHSGKVTEHVDYAAAHPYTLAYGVLLSPIGFICGSNPFGYAIVMSIMSTVVMVLLFDIIVKHTGKAAAFLGILIYNLLPMGFFQSQVVIHETALMFFHVLSFWLLLKVFETKRKVSTRIIYAVISLVLIVIGACANAAGNIVLISYAIFTTAKIFSTKSSTASKIKNFTYKGISVFFVLIVMAGCVLSTGVIKNKCLDIFVDTPPANTVNNSVKNGWGFYLGANYETSGAWNREDETTYYKYKEIEDKDEAIEYQQDLIKNRYGEYLENPLRIPKHIYKKIVILWSPYFTFRNVHNNPSYTAMSSFAGGAVKKGLIAITQLGYLLFYFMTFVGLFKNKKNPASEVTPVLHFMLVVVGLTLALLPFEVMAKYSSHAQILIFAVGIMNFSNYRKNMLSAKHCLSKKH